jgi:hypothetical protein
LQKLIGFDLSNPATSLFLLLPAASEIATPDNAKNEDATTRTSLSQLPGNGPEEMVKGRQIRSASVGREERPRGAREFSVSICL